ncbi:MAG: bifunctional fucokinase/fucose-1-phosphate guanylyltransferase [bacterium]
MDCLLSLPPAGVRAVASSAGSDSIFFAASDPPGRQLGSGGGTVNLLMQAWAQTAPGTSLTDWLASSRKLIVHGSGQSRRLPSYAAEGKPLLPLPLLPQESGQAPNQRLLDLQCQTCRRVFRHAPSSYRLMIACGDVHVRNEAPVPIYPEADVLIVGIHSSPEEASRHGVMFCAPDDSGTLRFFLQKPSSERVIELAGDHRYLLDTGMWLLSERAIRVLFSQCGVAPDAPAGASGEIQRYELFDTFALALGCTPGVADAEVSALSAAVLPFSQGRFYHFGTNRSVLASVAQLSAPAEDRRAFGYAGDETGGGVVVLHAQVDAPLPAGARQIWIENACISKGWHLSDRHVLTGIPINDWRLRLPAGICLDVLGLNDDPGVALRVYGFDDESRGKLEDRRTHWMGHSVVSWFEARGLSLAQAGLSGDLDIQDAPLFPVVAADAPDIPKLLHWMIEQHPWDDATLSKRWMTAPRVSASDLLQRADVTARQKQRVGLLAQSLASFDSSRWREAVGRLNLEATAQFVQNHAVKIAPPAPPRGALELADVHDAMFRFRIGHAPEDVVAFERLREILVNRMTLHPVTPRRNLLDDQIVWGRAPVRLDLAGGWTDTPPYCLEHGGHVVNVAVNLNGQPPIQAFARICEEPHIVIRSIDLGIGETLTTYAQIAESTALGGGFGIARAALRLAGFDPKFHANGGAADLATQLRRDFGGGIELSMLAAVPKGSGLGTSSILAATLLGTLGDLCGLSWDRTELFSRTLVLEQLLTSGGGWQDQVGGIIPGLKLIETAPGLVQQPVIRWLPSQAMQDAASDQRLLLYYTGLTRVAHNILGEIVRGIFLNDAACLDLIKEIGLNAAYAADAIQQQTPHGITETIRRSWQLNQALDSGVNPPAVQAILKQIAPWTTAAKLSGAGGGGYLIILAATPEHGQQIQQSLLARPPNPRARFVKLSISETGLQVTRS